MVKISRKFIRSLIAISFIFTLPNLKADLEDHYRKITDKGDNHTIRNIDFIYMINLDERTEKWDMSKKQLEPYGIYPYRFSAVNGWRLTQETVNDVGLKFSPGMQGGFMATSYHVGGDFEPSHEIVEKYGQTYFVHCMARGTIGIALSHLSILQDAYDAGYDTIWVMEDDIHVMKDPTIIPEMIDKLDRRIGKDNWDILFTDRDFRSGSGEQVPCSGAARRPDFYPRKLNNYARKRTYGPNFRRVGARYGATSMIYRRSGIEKMMSPIQFNSNTSMRFTLPPLDKP